MPTTRIAQPTTTARCGEIRPAKTWATADARIRGRDDAGHRMVVDADDVRQERRCDRREQSGHSEAGERRDGGDGEHGTNLRWYRKSLQHQCFRCAPRFPGRRGRPRRPAQPTPMCTMKLSCRGCGAYWTSRPASSGPTPESADIGRRRHRRGAVMPARRRRFDDRGGRGAGEDACRQPRQHAADQAAAYRIGDQEDRRRWRARTQRLRAESGACRSRRTTARTATSANSTPPA